MRECTYSKTERDQERFLEYVGKAVEGCDPESELCLSITRLQIRLKSIASLKGGSIELGRKYLIFKMRPLPTQARD
jgi:hypothetical protein